MAERDKSSKSSPKPAGPPAVPAAKVGKAAQAGDALPASVEKQRDRERTRGLLLKAAFEEIWSRGYSATSVDEIIAKTGFTKGAFYHHFGSKKQLALAVLDEVIGGMTRSRWIEPYAGIDDPLTPFIAWLREYQCSSCEYDVSHGCPLNNLAQELSNVDGDFQQQSAALFELWIGSIAEMIRRSAANGHARKGIDDLQAATFFVAAFEGGISLAKATGRPAPLKSVLGSLIAYLEEMQLSPKANTNRAAVRARSSK